MPSHPWPPQRYVSGKEREPARVKPVVQLPTVLEVDAARVAYRAAAETYHNQGLYGTRAAFEKELETRIEHLFPYPAVPKIVRAVLRDGSVAFYRVVKGDLQASTKEAGPFYTASHNEASITALFNLFQNPTQEVTNVNT